MKNELRAMTPYEAGEHARSEGLPLKVCPYAIGSKPARQWVAGWSKGSA